MIVLDVTEDVVVQIRRVPALVGDHLGRISTELAVEAERVRRARVGGPPRHRDRRCCRAARLSEPVDDLGVSARSRDVVHMTVAPAEPRPMPCDDERYEHCYRYGRYDERGTTARSFRGSHVLHLLRSRERWGGRR